MNFLGTNRLFVSDKCLAAGLSYGFDLVCGDETVDNGIDGKSGLGVDLEF